MSVTKYDVCRLMTEFVEDLAEEMKNAGKMMSWVELMNMK
jgi:hypothetical protein